MSLNWFCRIPSHGVFVDLALIANEVGGRELL